MTGVLALPQCERVSCRVNRLKQQRGCEDYTMYLSLLDVGPVAVIHDNMFPMSGPIPEGLVTR